MPFFQTDFTSEIDSMRTIEIFSGRGTKNLLSNGSLGSIVKGDKSEANEADLYE
jgi:hypothetical protein